MDNNIDFIGTLLTTPTVVGVLVFIFWCIISGKLITKGHHDETVQQAKENAERGWKAAEKADAELAEANKLAARLADSFAELNRALSSSERGRR